MSVETIKIDRRVTRTGVQSGNLAPLSNTLNLNTHIKDVALEELQDSGSDIYAEVEAIATATHQTNLPVYYIEVNAGVATNWNTTPAGLFNAAALDGDAFAILGGVLEVTGGTTAYTTTSVTSIDILSDGAILGTINKNILASPSAVGELAPIQPYNGTLFTKGTKVELKAQGANPSGGDLTFKVKLVYMKVA